MPLRKDGSQAATTPRPDATQPAATSQLRLYNTLSRQVETITPIEPDHLRMYSCGPTVYRYIHIGNLRTFTMADWIRRASAAQGLTCHAHQEHHRCRPYAAGTSLTGARTR